MTKEILFIDHYDSFSYNLITLFKYYYKKITIIKCDKINTIKSEDIHNKYSAVILSPGPGHPKEYTETINFYQNLPPNIPILGICLGLQLAMYSEGFNIEKYFTIPKHGRKIILKSIYSHILPNFNYQGTWTMYNSLGCLTTTTELIQQNWISLATENNAHVIIEHLFKKQIFLQFHPESFTSSGANLLVQKFISII